MEHTKTARELISEIITKAAELTILVDDLAELVDPEAQEKVDEVDPNDETSVKDPALGPNPANMPPTPLGEPEPSTDTQVSGPGPAANAAA